MTASSDDRRERQSTPDRAENRTHPAPPVAPWPGLLAAAAELGFSLSPDQVARFDTYQRLLREWNARFNLTAITEPAEIERRLFLDALRLIPVIAALPTAPDARLVDIGSGAGFPAIPLAIMQPGRPITLIEATGKKVTFLEHVISELGLTRVNAIHARAEDVAREPESRGAYDLATARAVSSLPALIELTMPLLRKGGFAVFPKGLDLEDELAAGQRAADLVGAEIVSDEVAPGGATRIVVVAKRRPTPERFPRRAGLPAREPLGIDTIPRPKPTAGNRPHQHGQRRPHPHHLQPDADVASRRIAG